MSTNNTFLGELSTSRMKKNAFFCDGIQMGFRRKFSSILEGNDVHVRSWQEN